MPDGWIPIVGDSHFSSGIGGGTATGKATLNDLRMVKRVDSASIVTILRAQGVKVQAADESAWRQLADALNALRRVYAKPTANVDPRNSSRVNVSETQLAKSNDPSFPKTASTERANKEKTDTAATQGSDAHPGVGFLRSMDSGKSWQVVGTCNTAKGCDALKAACSTLTNHTFKAPEGDERVGECIDQTGVSTSTFFLRNSNSPAAPSKNPATTTGMGEGGNNEVTHKRPGSSASATGGAGGGKIKFDEFLIKRASDSASPTIQCGGAVMCKKVKTTCATLRGTYTRINDVSGSCRHQLTN
jgi:hypothetical protein